MNIKSANGVSGHLLRTFNPGGCEYVFRVYNGDGTFTDYDLIHCDLHVTIDDPDAAFYQKDENTYLDHSPETLGIKEQLDETT